MTFSSLVIAFFHESNVIDFIPNLIHLEPNKDLSIIPFV
nr:MAG TPA: hypothetical protein [Caudoviricetes sp.]